MSQPLPSGDVRVLTGASDADQPHAVRSTQASDASFVSLINARQRAMLAEMGVRIWAPGPVPGQPATLQAPVRGAQPGAATQARPVKPARAGTPDTGPAARIGAPGPHAALASNAVTPPARPAGIDSMAWPELQATVAACEACGLCQSRKNTVFGAGDRQAAWMVVGEAPDEKEDLQGEPFVGLAGQLLDNMLRAVGRSRFAEGRPDQGVYIANALKCRSPANRNPLPEEVAQCEPYLARQVALVQPRIILAMGRLAVQSLLQTNEPIGRLRGRVHHYQGVPVVVTYPPASLLRTPADKAKAWADLCLAMEHAQPKPSPHS